MNDASAPGALASIVIPAHDEEPVIGTLLSGLTATDDLFEIVVVCNGCSDDTASVARSFGPAVQVIEIPQASKRIALQRGDEVARVFPRVYVDADVELDAVSVRRLIAALDGVVLAAAPDRELRRHASSRWVQWYYDVWEALPQVREGLFGRGVIALSQKGNERVRALPAMMGDDLAASDAFEPQERRVVRGASVTVWAPRTLGDLIRRRARAATGNAEADRLGVRRSTSITTPRTLVEMIRERPRLLFRVPVFLAVTAIGRIAARRAIRTGDTDTWLRDESSRSDRPAAESSRDPIDDEPSPGRDSSC